MTIDEKIGVLIGHGENTYDDEGSKGIVQEDGTVWEEFWFNEAVGRFVYQGLQDLGFEVVAPQKWDKDDVGLNYRSETVNDEETDLNVAIHANAGPEGAEGACIFYWGGSEGGKRFASIWLKHFKELCKEQGLHGDGIHISEIGEWTNFHVIRETEAVTDLIEHGFFTTKEQRERLKDKDFRKRCGEAIIKSVCEYFGYDYEQLKQTKGTPKPPLKDNVTTLSTKHYGDRVESIYEGSEGIDFYSKATLNDDYKVGTFDHGQGWTIRKKLQVGDNEMYEVKNSKGNVYFITAREDLVKVVEDSHEKESSSKSHVTLPASAETWGTYTLDEQPISENISWYLTPSEFGGLTYEILDRPYPSVVTIETSKGKRNIYVGEETSAVIK